MRGNFIFSNASGRRFTQLCVLLLAFQWAAVSGLAQTPKISPITIEGSQPIQA
jgi:hypothetical protein